MMFRSSLLVLAVVIGSTLALPAEAQWKWRDKSGRIQYSDIPPPPGIADSDILQQPTAPKRQVVIPIQPSGDAANAPASAASAASAPLTKGEPELEARRRQIEQDKATKAKLEEENLAIQRAANCIRAKGAVKGLEDGVRVSRTNEKGEREFLDDKQRAEELVRAKSIVASDCKQ
jgi:hypothetical protein